MLVKDCRLVDMFFIIIMLVFCNAASFADARLAGNGTRRAAVAMPTVAKERPTAGGSAGGRPGILLAHLPACRATVLLHCRDSFLTSNLDVLRCLQREVAVGQKIPLDCQHAAWQFKFNVTWGGRFDASCQAEVRRLPACARLPTYGGSRATCLIERLQRVKSLDCAAFLRRLKPIFFSDLRLIRPLLSECHRDILRSRCGRLDADQTNGSLSGSQGQTVACLGRHAAELQPACRQQLLRLSELQADDFHNDRRLFFACRRDRDKLCAHVAAGDGRIFACLSEQAESATEKCARELWRLKSLAALRFGIEGLFARACGEDLVNHSCVGKPKPGIVTAMLCLENQLVNDRAAVSHKCQAQMLRLRKEFASNPRLDPALAAGCDWQLKTCFRSHRPSSFGDGSLLHCLMRQVQSGESPASSANCSAAIGHLLRVAMPTRDLRVDPVVMLHCQSELSTHCKGAKNLYVCLKSLTADNFGPDGGKPLVSEGCAGRLAELQYFEDRDFRLNERLFTACRGSARRLCRASGQWWRMLERKDGHQPAAAVYNCLFNQMRGNSTLLNARCREEMQASLRERASRVQLDPRLYDPCIGDLSKFCSRHDGREFPCLQDNFGSLTATCRKAVARLTTDASRSLRLSPDAIFVRSCLPFVRKFCSRRRDSSGQLDSSAWTGSSMDCLIRLKEHPEMDGKCRAGVNHHQLLALKDFHFSYSFQQACKNDVKDFCGSDVTKAKVLRCLSNAVRNDTLLDRRQRVSYACRQRLTVEMLAKSRSVELSPDLAACLPTVRSACSDSFDQIDCLNKFEEHLDPACLAALFEWRRRQMAMPNYDRKLLVACRSSIAHACAHVATDSARLFRCLTGELHSGTLKPACRSVVTRRMRQQQLDYRLNPDLQHYCGADIQRVCRTEVSKVNNRTYPSEDAQLDGAVTRCLRRAVLKNEEQVSDSCRVYIRGVTMEYNLNYKLDPRLARACESVVKSQCANELMEVDDDVRSSVKVTECLRHLLVNRQLMPGACKREVSYLLREASADIHVDPQLHMACSSEITRLCSDVRLGNGRRMACAVSAFKDPMLVKRLSRKCARELSARIEMFEAANALDSPKDFRQVYDSVRQSPSYGHFQLVGVSVVAALLLVGFCTGRITKRVRRIVRRRRLP